MTTNTEQLKPCPFCSAKQSSLFIGLVLRLAFWKAGFHVECWKCGAEGPKRVTSKRAVEAWNRRAQTGATHE